MPRMKKTCAKCQAPKPPQDFNRYCRSLDGLQAYCRDCARLINIAWREKARNAADDATIAWLAGLTELPAVASCDDDPTIELAQRWLALCGEAG